MTKEKMTIHEALSELKMLDKRIEKTIKEASFCASNKKSNTKINGISIEDFKAKTKADLESCKDLIRRQTAIKRAITLSNAKTEVTVGDVTYIVAEAIAMHNHGMIFKRKLLNDISAEYLYCKDTCDRYNENLEDKAIRDVNNFFANDTSENKEEKIKNMIKERIAEGTYSIVSGIDCVAEIDALSNEIDKFESKIDAALSVSNATTVIEFEY